MVIGFVSAVMFSFSAISQNDTDNKKLSLNYKRLKVLLINSGDQNLPMEQNILSGLKSKLTSSPIKADIYSEYLDSARFSEITQHDIFANYLQRKYLGKSIDLVISNGIPAANFLSHHAELFGEIKHLFVHSGQVNVDDVTNKIYIDASNNYKKSIRDLVRLTSPKKIVVLADSTSSLARVHFKHLKAELDLLYRSIEIEYFIDAPLSELEHKVSNLKPGSIVLFTPIFRHKSGGRQTPFQTLNSLSLRSTVPIFSFWGSFIGSGVVGGYMLSGEKVGEAMGNTIIDIAIGREIEEYSIDFFNEHIYDWRQLSKYKYDVISQFPDAKISFYQPTFFEKYKMGILFTVILFLVLSVFIFLLIIINAKRKVAIKECFCIFNK